MKKNFTTIKAMTRSVVDYCVLPGAFIGAEILWMYSMQWKNKASWLLIGLISFVYSNMQIVLADQVNRNTITGPENTR